MRYTLIILFTLITLAGFAQHNPNPQAYMYGTLSEAIRKPMEIGSIVQVKGEGVFMADTLKAGEIVDGGVIIAKPSGSSTILRRDVSNAHGVNVKWFGAKGDGVTDDYNAIVAAVNATPKTVDGFQGTLYFPPGKYRKSKTIYIQKPITLKGDGNFFSDASIVVTDNGQDGFVFCAPIAADAQHAAITSAQGFIVDGLASYQADGTKSIGDGYWAKVRGSFFNLNSRNWAGNGIRIEANGVPVASYNKIVSIDVAQPGSYADTTRPAVTITPTNGGSGAAAHAILGGKVTSTTITDGGSRYILRPIIRIEKDTFFDRNTIKTVGWGATGDAILQVDTIVITNGGSGYSSATVQFVGSSYTPATGEIIDSSMVVGDTTSNDTTSIPANATVNIVGGQITGIVITNRGEYAGMPKVVITGNGTGATAKAYGNIKRIVINDVNGGSWFEPKDTPAVHFIGGHEAGDVLARDAAAKVNGMGKWRLKRVVIDNAGDNYYKEPVISISGGNIITQATARALIGRDQQGNANNFILEKVRSVANSNGFFNRGSDANAGMIIGCDFSFNLQMGVWAESFLNNTYEALHTSTNSIAPFFAPSATATNSWVNPYTEGNQPPSAMVKPNTVINGNLGSRILQKPGGSNAYRMNINGISGAVTIQNELTNQIHTIGLGTNSVNGNILTSTFTNFGNTYYLPRQSAITGDLIWSYGNTEGLGGMMRINGAGTTTSFGRDSAVPYGTAIKALFLGSTSNDFSGYRNITYSSTFPPRKQDMQKGWTKGDFVFNSNPNTTTGILGWLRLTTGTGDVAGVDWLTITASINNQNTTLQTFTFNIGSSQGMSITNHSTIAPTMNSNIINSGLNIIARAGADGYYSPFHIYQSGLIGMDFNTWADNSSSWSQGVYYRSLANSYLGGYYAHSTTASAIAQFNGTIHFLLGNNLTVGATQALTDVETIDSTGMHTITPKSSAAYGLKVSMTSGASTGELRFGNKTIYAYNNGVLDDLTLNGNNIVSQGNFRIPTGKAFTFDDFTGATRGFARININSNNDLQFITNSGTTNMTLQSSTGNVTFGAGALLHSYTVATLPTGAIGLMAEVTDAFNPINGNAVIGGGATKVPVIHNGTSWIVMGAGGFWLLNGTTVSTTTPSYNLTIGGKLKVGTMSTGTTAMKTVVWDNSDSTFKTITTTATTATSAIDQSYTGTFVSDGTLASTPASLKYSWSSDGKFTTLKIRFKWNTPSGNITTVSFPLPTDCPAPAVPSDVTSDQQIIAAGNVVLQPSNNASLTVTDATKLILKKLSTAPSGFQIEAVGNTFSYQGLFITLIYQNQ